MPDAGHQGPIVAVDCPEAPAELGRVLCFDPQLSDHREVSPATRHHPAAATGDGRIVDLLVFL